MRLITTITIIFIIISSLSACSGLRFPGVYRQTIQQGNIITQEMVDQLKPGMTKRQVNFVLGTPMVMDTFNDNRWDYLYTIRVGGTQSLTRNLTVYFEDDKLTHFDGDYKPTPAETDDPETDTTEEAELNA